MRRGLWKLPGGGDCLRGKLSLVLMSGGHAHKYLIQFKDLMKLYLKLNPIHVRDTGRAETYLVCTRTQGPYRD